MPTRTQKEVLAERAAAKVLAALTQRPEVGNEIREVVAISQLAGEDLWLVTVPIHFSPGTKEPGAPFHEIYYLIVMFEGDETPKTITVVSMQKGAGAAGVRTVEFDVAKDIGVTQLVRR